MSDVIGGMEDGVRRECSMGVDGQYSEGSRDSVSSSNSCIPNVRGIHTNIWKQPTIQINPRTHKHSFPRSLIKVASFLPFGFVPLPVGNPPVASKIIPKVAEHKEQIAQVAGKIHSPFSISHFLGIHQKIEEIAADLHRQALLTPDPSDDKIDYLQYLYNSPDIGILTRYSPDWFKDIIIYLTAAFGDLSHNLIQVVFKAIYSLLTNVIIWTPEWLFADAWFPESISKFTILSMLTLIIGIMIQGLKRITRMSYTSFTKILKRIPVALLVTMVSPFLFSHGIRLLNKATDLIADIAKTEIASNELIGFSSAQFIFEPINIIMMLAFLILVGFLTIPLFIFHGRRWFTLLCNGALTPFAMICYVFDETKPYFNAWLDSIKNIGLQQLIYSVFIGLLGLIMFATPNPTTFYGIFTKMLIMVGGIATLASPPSIVKNIGRDNQTFVDVYKELHAKGKQIKTEVFGDYDKEKGKQIKDGYLVGGAKIAGKGARLVGKIYRKIKD